MSNLENGPIGAQIANGPKTNRPYEDERIGFPKARSFVVGRVKFQTTLSLSHILQMDWSMSLSKKEFQLGKMGRLYLKEIQFQVAQRNLLFMDKLRKK